MAEDEDEGRGVVPTSQREALRGIWLADRYPIRGNEDWRTAARVMKEALERATTEMSATDDPPEFAKWITALGDPKLPDHEREDIMSGIYDLFEPEDPSELPLDRLTQT